MVPDKISAKKLQTLFGLSPDQLRALAENGIVQLAESGKSVSLQVPQSTEVNGLVRLQGGGFEIPLIDMAEMLKITERRAQQLADAGVVCKTRRGYCHFSETLHRWTAYQIEEQARASHRGTSPEGRDETYWEAQGRNVQLMAGATEGELSELARVVADVVRARAVEHQMGEAASSKSGEEAATEALDAAIGGLMVQLCALQDAAFKHASWMDKRKAKDFTSAMAR